MKLYDVPRNSYIYIPSADLTLYFHHIDGAYSLCKTKDGHIIHLGATTLVEIVDKPEDFKEENG